MIAEPPATTQPQVQEEPPKPEAPLRLLVAVLVALVVLTGVNAGAGLADLGEVKVVVVLLLATVQAALVALFFMRIGQNPFHALLFLGCVAVLLLLVGMTTLDAKHGQSLVEPAYAESAMARIRKERGVTWVGGVAEGGLSGDVLFQKNCKVCHNIEGPPLIGPTLGGVYGSKRKGKNKDGSITSVDVDEAYLRESILDPAKRLSLEGQEFPNLMIPTFGQTLSDAEVDALVEYLKGL
jgi:caa(3)-type oxidase subunit IV